MSKTKENIDMTEKKFIAENFLTMTDREMGAELGKSRGQIQYLRKKMNLNRQAVFKEVLKEQGFDGDNWAHGWLKTDEASIFIRNNDGIISYEEMKDDLLREMKRHAPKYRTLRRKKIKDGHLLVIDPADIHIGKLALLAETNEEYNIEIAKKRCIEGVQGLLQKASGFPIEKIVFVIGNDILHIDSPHRRTTAGTPQDTDGQWWQMFKEAKDLYIQILEMLIPIANVDVVFCPSNHDYMTGFMLADTLSSWFHKTKNVTFQANIVHRKYVEYGLNMLAFDHGDGCKERDAKDLMADEEPQMWGRTKFRYAYKHHVHHKKKLIWASGEDFIGVTVEYLRTPSSADGWHHRNGYVGVPKAVEGFVHSKEGGQVARLVHYFL